MDICMHVHNNSAVFHCFVGPSANNAKWLASRKTFVPKRIYSIIDECDVGIQTIWYAKTKPAKIASDAGFEAKKLVHNIKVPQITCMDVKKLWAYTHGREI